jgi:hypothetical protein
MPTLPFNLSASPAAAKAALRTQNPIIKNTPDFAAFITFITFRKLQVVIDRSDTLFLKGDPAMAGADRKFPPVIFCPDKNGLIGCDYCFL